MKTPITYYGGKQNMAKWIVSNIPRHKVYAEPFTGGGAVFFEKEPAKINVLNDKNEMLVNFYKVCSDEEKAVELEKRLTTIPYAESEFRKYKDKNKRQEFDDDIDKAVACFIGSNWSFSGVFFAGGYAFGKIRPRNEYSHFNKILRFKEASEKLKKSYIFNRDALDIIRRFDSEETFFYLDPPYIGADQKHYAGYKQDDFNSLLELLKEIKGKFLLSHYCNDIAERQGFHRIVKEVSCAAMKVDGEAREKRTEILYSNFDTGVGNGF